MAGGDLLHDHRVSLGFYLFVMRGAGWVGWVGRSGVDMGRGKAC